MYAYIKFTWEDDIIAFQAFIVNTQTREILVELIKDKIILKSCSFYAEDSVLAKYLRKDIDINDITYNRNRIVTKIYSDDLEKLKQEVFIEML